MDPMIDTASTYIYIRYIVNSLLSLAYNNFAPVYHVLKVSGNTFPIVVCFGEEYTAILIEPDARIKVCRSEALDRWENVRTLCNSSKVCDEGVSGLARVNLESNM